MPAPLRIILSPPETITLEELSYANGVPRRTKQRAIALRMNAQGWNVPDIAEHLGWAQATVRQTIERWNSAGLMGLWDAPRPGRNRTWGEDDWQVIEALGARTPTLQRSPIEPEVVRHASSASGTGAGAPHPQKKGGAGGA